MTGGLDVWGGVVAPGKRSGLRVMRSGSVLRDYQAGLAYRTDAGAGNGKDAGRPRMRVRGVQEPGGESGPHTSKPAERARVA